VKRFTKQLWIDLQEPDEVGREASRRWDEALEAYSRELESLRERLAPDVFEFFRTADVHDGSLIPLRLTDFDPSAPVPPTPSTDPDPADDGPFEGPYRLIVEMAVTNDYTNWTLRY